MALGFKFFQGLESTTVKGIRAVRARYEGPDAHVVEVQFKPEHKGLPILQLDLTPDQAGELIQQLTTAYIAIRPPLAQGQNAAGWQGME